MRSLYDWGLASLQLDLEEADREPLAQVKERHVIHPGAWGAAAGCSDPSPQSSSVSVPGRCPLLFEA